MHWNRCIVSKVTAILMNGWILPTGWVASGRVCPAACAVCSRLVFLLFHFLLSFCWVPRHWLETRSRYHNSCLFACLLVIPSPPKRLRDCVSMRMEWWNDGRMEIWNYGIMVWLIAKMMEWWNKEMIEWWNAGMKELWNEGIME